MKYFPATARPVIDRRPNGAPPRPPAAGDPLDRKLAEHFSRFPAELPHRTVTAAPAAGAPSPPAASTGGTGAAPAESEPAARSASGETGTARPAAAPARVLVVDDDPAIRSVLVRMLGDAGFAVGSAPDGEAGWAALCDRDFDVLVTDHDMPRLSGLGLLRRMRAAMRNVPVVFMSARLPWEERDLPRLLQPGLVMEKPFSMAQLIANVRGALAVGGRPSPAAS